MVALVTRFEELLAPTANGGVPSEDAADAGASTELVPVPLGRSQHAINLTNAAHQITHHSMSLQKTRLHFQKVRPVQPLTMLGPRLKNEGCRYRPRVRSYCTHQALIALQMCWPPLFTLT